MTLDTVTSAIGIAALVVIGCGVLNAVHFRGDPEEESFGMGCVIGALALVFGAYAIAWTMTHVRIV